MDVVKKIFENKDVNNGGSISWEPENNKYVYANYPDANLSGLVINLSGRFKENDS